MNRFFKSSILPCMLVTILCVLVFRSGVTDAARPAGCGAWSMVSSPNSAHPNNTLLGVAALSANDVWAVGYSSGQKFHTAQTLVEHWDGTQWKLVTSPSPGPTSKYDLLVGVAAIAINDVWAVGYYDDGYGLKTLIERWDGTQWNVVSSPNHSGSSGNSLNGVTAISANDIWAIGSYTDNRGNAQTLTEHWDGTRWSIAASPNFGSHYNFLYAGTAISSSDIWAVGAYDNNNFINQTLIEHWDGTRWSIVSSPNNGGNTNELTGVAATSTSDVWAVGDFTSGRSDRTLLEHWDGTRWSIIPSPGPNASYLRLAGVAATSGSDVWVVGYYIKGISPYQTLIEHWDGKQWSVVPSPNPGSVYVSLLGVTEVPATNQVWTVGYYSHGSAEQTLIEHYC